MANKRITDVDFVDSLNSNESFFVNQNNSIKQINKGSITFDIINGGTGAKNAEDARVNLGLGSVAIENVVPIEKGGTAATTLEKARANLGIIDIPTVTTDDNGKFMQVVDGVWTAVTIDNAEGGEY